MGTPPPFSEKDKTKIWWGRGGSPVISTCCTSVRIRVQIPAPCFVSFKDGCAHPPCVCNPSTGGSLELVLCQPSWWDQIVEWAPGSVRFSLENKVGSDRGHLILEFASVWLYTHTRVHIIIHTPHIHIHLVHMHVCMLACTHTHTHKNYVSFAHF